MGKHTLHSTFLKLTRPSLTAQVDVLGMVGSLAAEHHPRPNEAAEKIEAVTVALKRLSVEPLSSKWGARCKVALDNANAVVQGLCTELPPTALLTRMRYNALRFKSIYGAMTEGLGTSPKIKATRIEYEAIEAVHDYVALLMRNGNHSESAYQLKDIHTLMLDHATRTHLKDYKELWVAICETAIEIMSRFTPDNDESRTTLVTLTGSLKRPLINTPEHVYANLVALRFSTNSAMLGFKAQHNCN